MKAKIGDKKRFSTIKEKKSIIMTPLRFVFSFFEIYKDDKKLRNNIPIKNSLLKKMLKIKILNKNGSVLKKPLKVLVPTMKISPLIVNDLNMKF